MPDKGGKEIYLFSLTLWQRFSTEKLKASANAMASHIDCLVAATMVITRQNKQTITVRACFSAKYFFIIRKFNSINSSQIYLIGLGAGVILR